MGKQTISKDTPLNEITLRKYEKPKVEGRELVRKVCLNLGLLQPGDSRDVMVDILYVLLKAGEEKEEINSEEVRFRVVKERKKRNLPIKGVASSNVRRQLKRLKDLFVIEDIRNNYRMTEHLPLSEIFEDKIEGFLLQSILKRNKEYLEALDEEFSKNK